MQLQGIELQTELSFHVYLLSLSAKKKNCNKKHIVSDTALQGKNELGICQFAPPLLKK
jgi:hypothetical protein